LSQNLDRRGQERMRIYAQRDECPLLALSGFGFALRMSAFGGKADIARRQEITNSWPQTTRQT
jgi:hypothetical protein